MQKTRTQKVKVTCIKPRSQQFLDFWSVADSLDCYIIFIVMYFHFIC